MTEQTATKSKHSLINGIALLLIGLSALVFALAFANKSFSSEVKFPKIPKFPEHPKLPEQKLGFTVVTSENNIFLINKETGKVWKRAGSYTGKWCLEYVEDITPRPTSGCL